MSKAETQKRGATHNEALRQALLRLIEINIPSRFDSERQMAEELGIIPAHFSQMKNGHRSIGKESASRIEKGLGLDTGGLYRFQGNDLALDMPLATDNISTRYERSDKTRKALIDLALAGKDVPDWVTNSIRYQYRALLVAISETLESKKKRRSR